MCVEPRAVAEVQYNELMQGATAGSSNAQRRAYFATQLAAPTRVLA